MGRRPNSTFSCGSRQIASSTKRTWITVGERGGREGAWEGGTGLRGSCANSISPCDSRQIGSATKRTWRGEGGVGRGGEEGMSRAHVHTCKDTWEEVYISSGNGGRVGVGGA